MAAKSETFFKRTLDQKTVESREAVAECIREFLSPTTKSRQDSAKKAYDAVDRVREMLHESDRPEWLGQLHSKLSVAYAHNGDANGVNAVHAIASTLFPSLQQHQWHIGDSEEAQGFDFDAVYNKYSDEARIPDLFDQIIQCLKEIIATDKVDSVKALRELNNIIATLHRARNGSYFATRGAWFFVTTWFKNSGWELLGTIPIAGSMVKGLRKTLQDTNDTMLQLHDNIQSDMETRISTDFPRLEYEPPKFPAIADYSDVEDEKAT